MKAIHEIITKYKGRIDFLDLELIISHILKKPREFVLAHPEKTITKKQETITKKLIKRRIQDKPLAYILGHKEFYGLDFIVNKNVLIPRPETELLVEETLKYFLKTKNQKPFAIVDVGTGSGNIIISIAKNFKKNCKLIGTDTSKKALVIAKQNAKKHKVDKKIKFITGNFLEPFFNISPLISRLSNLIIVANLPYLSPKIYKTAPKSVKKYEPIKALISQNNGLAHYKKLFKQIKRLSGYARSGKARRVFIEFSPEQKKQFENMIKKIIPTAKIIFKKDLAQKFRVAIVKI